MGYTHYWTQTRDFTDKEWGEVMREAGWLAEDYADIICYEENQPNRAPLVGKSMIRFNGKDVDGHDTFILTRKQDKVRQREDGCFHFCKTAYKPYDEAVVEMLKVAKKIAPDAIRLASDGGPEIFGENYFGEEDE